MAAVVMDTRATAVSLRQQLRQETQTFSRQHNHQPSLVMLGSCHDQSTIDIIRIVGRIAAEVGVRFTAQLFPPHIKAAEIRKHIEHYNQDPEVNAISLQLPLPSNLAEDEIASYIAPEKEVEGLHPVHMGQLNMGNPTIVSPPALSALKILSLYNINPAGRHVVIVGRNLEIGRPLASLFTRNNATITLCHSQTTNLLAHTRQAEILITAAGKAGLIKADMVRPGAVVIDYGINYNGKGALTGDVEFEKVKAVAGALTPMPGGTGPLTIICLLENTLKVARHQALGHAETIAKMPTLNLPEGKLFQANVMPEIALALK